jgi:hypothetical protein
MPQILTASWFARLAANATPVGVSRGTPRGKAGYRRLRELEPGPWFKSVSPEQYLALYGEILARLDPAEVYERLLSLGEIPRSCSAGRRPMTATLAGNGAIGIA